MSGKVKHGMIDTRIYKTWCDMKTRCLNKNYKRFDDYGGQGNKGLRRVVRL